ncbi:hypothetical protein CN939_30650 [Bacillus thuringiensis]|uniref:hypothetical protein n=1 Tax=Bacillus thuringiensis TaxID=1428 RepID=UPI000BED58BE|nr:hypothetical protein [Bacillus thuringiensis]PEF84675.1 hypothetical protein CON51_25635 [Bacillus thuringiensis]PES58650.1 hypothetical protein CN506_07410 [Bacillus thuringiensis]PFS65352.1 hypothetical protein COK64_03170 [Bacillus thuringiensis]PGL56948.1 hypothetical protein CN939_30650 [Bacillus thuringiensis]
MNPIFAKTESLYKRWQSKLTEREEGIMILLFEVGKNSRVETYTTGDTKVFMRNVKSTIKKFKINGPTIIFQPNWNETLRTIKKLEQIGMMKLDEDGLPRWFYRDWDDIEEMMNDRA